MWKKGIFLLLALSLCACSSQKSYIKYFEKHPDQIQAAAGVCIQKAKSGKNIEKNTKCMAVVTYEAQWCAVKQKEGAWYYMNKDCRNKPQMLWMAYDGF